MYLSYITALSAFLPLDSSSATWHACSHQPLLLLFANPLHFYISAFSLFFSTSLFLYTSTFLLPDLTSTAHDSCWPMQKAKSWGRTGVTTGNARKQQPSAAFLRRCTTRASTDRVRRRAIMVVCVWLERLVILLLVFLLLLFLYWCAFLRRGKAQSNYGCVGAWRGWQKTNRA